MIQGWNRSNSAEAASRAGTTASNTPAGASSRSAAPASEPAIIGGHRKVIRLRWPSSSSRDASAAPTAVGISPVVLVTFASSGGSPSARSTGKVSSEAPPAIALAAPATTPAAASTSSSGKVIRAMLSDGRRCCNVSHRCGEPTAWRRQRAR